MDAVTLICSKTCDVESFLAIVQNGQKVTLEQVVVEGKIGAEGWAKMAEACTHLGLRRLVASRECMGEGERGDLKTIWDALANDGYWDVERVLIDGTLRDISTCWETEEEKERKWEGLQVGIQPLSIMLNVHHMIIISSALVTNCALQEVLDKPADEWSTGLKQEWDEEDE